MTSFQILLLMVLAVIIVFLYRIWLVLFEIRNQHATHSARVQSDLTDLYGKANQAAESLDNIADNIDRLK